MVAYAHAYDVTLAWDPNTEPDLAGYILYIREDEPESNFHQVDYYSLDEIDPNNPQGAVNELESGKTYFFAVTAINNDGLESNFSNQVSVMNDEIVDEEVIKDNMSAESNQVYTGNSSGGGGGCFIMTANDPR
jgi:fibronectin type 3 domain-containing protein